MLTIKKIAEQINCIPLVPDRGGYTITMREDLGCADTLRRLQTMPGAPQRLHMGWGSFRNLDISSTRLSSFILICDINLHQLKIWWTLAEVMLVSDSAEQFVSRLATDLPKEPPLRQFIDSTLEWLKKDSKRPESWLFEGRPERFQHIKMLFQRNAVAFTCLDLRAGHGANGKHFKRLKDLLTTLFRQDQVHLDTLYISNIPYMLKKSAGFFGEPHLGRHDTKISTNETYDAYQHMWHNLFLITNPETLLISAEFLSEDCKPDNLQWITRMDLIADLQTNGGQVK